MVRPEGLEPTAYWFEATKPLCFIDLALGTIVVQGCALLRVIKDFNGPAGFAGVTLRNASTQGVGTKMGTLRSA